MRPDQRLAPQRTLPTLLSPSTLVRGVKRARPRLLLLLPLLGAGWPVTIRVRVRRGGWRHDDTVHGGDDARVQGTTRCWSARTSGPSWYPGEGHQPRGTVLYVKEGEGRGLHPRGGEGPPSLRRAEISHTHPPLLRGQARQGGAAQQCLQLMLAPRPVACYPCRPSPFATHNNFGGGFGEHATGAGVFRPGLDHHPSGHGWGGRAPCAAEPLTASACILILGKRAASRGAPSAHACACARACPNCPWPPAHSPLPCPMPHGHPVSDSDRVALNSMKFASSESAGDEPPPAGDSSMGA